MLMRSPRHRSGRKSARACRESRPLRRTWRCRLCRLGSLVRSWGKCHGLPRADIEIAKRPGHLSPRLGRTAGSGGWSAWLSTSDSGKHSVMPWDRSTRVSIWHASNPSLVCERVPPTPGASACPARRSRPPRRRDMDRTRPRRGASWRRRRRTKPRVLGPHTPLLGGIPTAAKVGPVIATAVACAVVAVLVAVSGGSGSTVRVEGGSPLAVGAASDPPSASAAFEGGEVVVEIVGAVPKPGVYRLPPGTQVVDLLQLAGGFGPRVDTARAEQELNLAAPVKDGDHIRVPSRDDDRGTTSRTSPAGSAAGALVDINTATRPSSRSYRASGPPRPRRSSPRARTRRSARSRSSARGACSARRRSRSCVPW